MFFTKDKIYLERRRPKQQQDQHRQQQQQRQAGMFTFQPPPLSSQEIDIALHHAQQGVEQQQQQQQPYLPGVVHQTNPLQHPHYSSFSGGGSIRSPFITSSNSDNHHHHSESSMNTQEQVRRTNLAVALANGIVSPRASYIQLHPMMCVDGRFPADFQGPRTVEGVLLLDNTQLDRILQEYKIYSDARSLLVSLPLCLRSTNTMRSTSRLRQAKLHILLEYLGAVRIVEDRSKRAGF
ncbi:hypothetical protein GX50_01988 [[Emmonsia] crescens]|uniref:Uncharacterized protein n=1 Tax=[Emmonsia] crescens TaxID=73230 RepID=A0A2B7ZMG3_9EURO|nr:hypothetical protein GX50_01988 [Emmonsia crescens]